MTHDPSPHVIDHDAIWPRDDDHRYRLYARNGRDLRILAAAASIPAIGLAIQTLHEDAETVGRRLADEGQIGILDAVHGKWLVLPFNRREGA